MECYFPIVGYRGDDGVVRFTGFRGGETMEIRCGRCFGCRITRSQSWAVRLMHESRLYSENCFITLTFDERFLPDTRSNWYPVFQKFMKRLRSYFKGREISYFAVGEYGDNFLRPHFHALLFGVDFPRDRVVRRSGDFELYESRVLNKLWSFGIASFGTVTGQSAGYVARYCLKKVNGDLAESHYKRVDPDTGEVFEVFPEMCHMSLKRGGIGVRFFERYVSDFEDGYAVLDGRKVPLPAAYRRKLLKAGGDRFAESVARSDKLLRSQFSDRSYERLAVKEVVSKARLSSLKRSI